MALAGRLGLSTATPEQLETHIRSYYTDPTPLEFIVDGTDVDRKISLLAHDASRMLHRTRLAAADDIDPTQPCQDPGTERLRRSIKSEKRTPRSPPDTPAADPPGSADHGSRLERGVRGTPSSPRSHARSPVGLWAAATRWDWGDQ